MVVENGARKVRRKAGVVLGFDLVWFGLVEGRRVWNLELGRGFEDWRLGMGRSPGSRDWLLVGESVDGGVLVGREVGGLDGLVSSVKEQAFRESGRMLDGM